MTATAHCNRCDWTTGPGTPADIDKAADKHTRAGHTTATVITP